MVNPPMALNVPNNYDETQIQKNAAFFERKIVIGKLAIQNHRLQFRHKNNLKYNMLLQIQ